MGSNRHRTRSFLKAIVAAACLFGGVAPSARAIVQDQAPAAGRAQGGGEQRTTPLPPPQKPVDYRNPERSYDLVELQGWKVHVERPLQQEQPELAKKSLARLGAKLKEAMDAFPPASRPELKTLELYLMIGPEAKGGGRDNGLEFFQASAPDHNPTLDSRWRRCVVIYSAQNYVRISDFWALKALVHEFAHARQLLRWPEQQPDILNAWRHAMQAGLYHNVKDDAGKELPKAYACVNQLEYFAELSCMYFVGCNYFPFHRDELRQYDPAGYAMIRKMWEVE